MKVAFAIGR